MPNSSPIDWRSIFLEAFFVVLGVVLALGANSLREQRSNERRAETALTSIVDEMRSNQHLVEASIDYHSYLMDTLYKFTARFGDDKSRFPSGRIFHKGFVNPARIVSRAWDAVETTGVIEFIPFETVLQVSQVYENQRQYELQGSAIGSELYARIYDDGLEGLSRNYKNILTIIGTFVYRECELVRAYGDALLELVPGEATASVPAFCQQLPPR